MIRGFVSLILCMVLAAPVAANQATTRAAEMLKKAEAALAAARTPKDRLAATGRAAQAQEAALAALRIDLRALADRRAGLAATMTEKERRLGAVLAALQRLERAPRIAAVAHPGGALSAARAGMTLSAFAPALEVEAAKLRIALDELAALRASRDVAAAEARASLAALQAARAEIATLLNRDRKATTLPPGLVRRLADEGIALAEGAATLSALSSTLPAAGIAAPEAGFSRAKGTLIPPIEGRLTRHFGEKGPLGPLDGVEVSAPAYAEIYAPWRAVVRFAGAYGEYGGVMILEPEAGTLVVLAGFASMRRIAGETVLAGEPLGLLAGPTTSDEEFLMAAASTVEAPPTETLYMELRVKGEPVDPADWFMFQTDERERK